VTDHEGKNSELMTLAQQKNVTPPTSLDEKHRKMIDGLREKSGEDFDETYMEQQVDAHQKMIDLFEKAANDSQDADVKAFAQQTLPALQQHLQMAKDIDQEVEKRTQKEDQGKRYIVRLGGWTVAQIQ
jgi:putative membrane protein